MLCERVMLHEDTSSWWRALVGRACQEATSRALQLCSPNHPPWATEHAGVATAGGEAIEQNLQSSRQEDVSQVLIP